jgi:hypothetical protein
MTKVNMSGWSQEQMANWQDPMLAGTGFNRPGVKPRQQFIPPQTGLSGIAGLMGSGGLGGLAGNKNLQDRLKFLSTFQQGGGQHPLQTPQYPSRPKQYDVAGGFEEQLGGFGEQFSGMEEQFGGVGEDINEINERLGGIEEGISTLKISKPEQKQNPYANMFNPFSFIGNWGGSRSRMSYR